MIVLAGLCSCAQPGMDNCSFNIVTTDERLNGEIAKLYSEMGGYLNAADFSEVTVKDFCSRAVGAHLLGYDEHNYNVLDYFSKNIAETKTPSLAALGKTIHELYLWTGDKRLQKLDIPSCPGIRDIEGSHSGLLLGTDDRNDVFSVLDYIAGNLVGFSPYAPRDSFSVISGAPAGYGRIGMTGIPIGKHLVNVVHNTSSSTSVSHVKGDSDITCTAIFKGCYKRILVNGRAFSSLQSVMDDNDISSVTVHIPAGTSVTIEALAE